MLEHLLSQLPEVIRSFIASHPKAELLAKTFLQLDEGMKKEAEDYFSYATAGEKQGIVDWILWHAEQSDIPTAEELEAWYKS